MRHTYRTRLRRTGGFVLTTLIAFGAPAFSGILWPDFLRGYVAWKGGDAARARQLLGNAREALGPEWTPEGMTSEGDVRSSMHVDATPLSRYWESWNGEADPATAFAELDRDLRRRSEP